MPKLSKNRILEQPGFILHRYPYRETSVVLDVFTHDYGRVSLVAKGAKRPYSNLRNVLHHFQPLTLSWSGVAQLRTLIRAEWVGGMLPLTQQYLLYGFYLNELILKFCAREDPYEQLFICYSQALDALSKQMSAAPILRHFEYQLLSSTGHIAELDWCAVRRQKVRPDDIYIYHPEQGVCLANESEVIYEPKVYGQTLLDIKANSYTNETSLNQSKHLMRYILHTHLQGASLKTRTVLMDLHKAVHSRLDLVQDKLSDSEQEITV